ncbi:hypothetical protein [Bacteroides sp.]|uniref:hypothetical protein n=1 Tax=Bacteroides sp. TaxID=29523 RepID=UPI0025BC65A0|nr:hypothetical protein [Bacteroides sp.]
MSEIVITKITVVDADGQRTSHSRRYVLSKSDLEEYRESIVQNGNDVDHILFVYEEVGDD